MNHAAKLCAIAARVKRQHAVRVAADPELETWIGGSLGSGACVYAARTQAQAVDMHAHRRDRILRNRRAEREASPPEPYRDSPFCPECTLPCGTADRADIASSSSWVCCGACGHSWESEADRAQAAKADDAYAKRRIDEEIEAQDRARLGPELWDRNAKMLSDQGRRRAGHRPAVQAALFEVDR